MDATKNRPQISGIRIIRRLLRLSFRTRLALAFAALIVSSASATIFIGNAIFGQKTNELARARLELDLKVADQIMSTRLQRLRFLAPAMSSMVSGDTIDPKFCSYQLEDTPFDFVAIFTSGNVSIMRIRRESCTVQRLIEQEVIQLKGSPLGEMASQAFSRGETCSGLVVLSPKIIQALGYDLSQENGLFMAAVSPLKTGGQLILGAMLNHRTELVETTLRLLSFQGNVEYKSSIFLDDVRIATTLQQDSVGTRVDPEVAKTVLQTGKIYAGSANVLGRVLYSAYEPLRDYHGQIVGMLGIATDEDIYGYIRSRTITLFTTLIVVGMIFGLLMSYWFSKKLIRPVADLAEGMNRVAQGDLNYKVRIDSGDELGRLAKAFNLMGKAVKERDMRLHEMTDEKLSQVEKQVSVGRLAAGVAHEINNPLTAVLSLSMLMRKHISPDDKRIDDLDIIITETTRCRDIVRSLLDFARERPPEKQLIDINQVLRDTLALTAKYEALAQRKTDVRLSPNPLQVHADAKQIQQVFTNVIINAAEATPLHGTITISSDEDSSGGFVVVEVVDNGKGIPKEFLNRVFEPFFTTKGSGKGTGLGLSVSLGIVQRHNGTIEIESEDGKGAKVSVILPRIAPEKSVSN